MNQSFQNIVKPEFVKRILRKRRQHNYAKHYDKVADFWRIQITEYYNGELEHYKFSPKRELGTDKIIWQYWGQGTEKSDLPEIIQICFNSVDKYAGDYLIIRLSDKNISEYLDFPDFMWKENGEFKFNRTFFSDVLRLALLEAYGGVWLDATILMTDYIPKRFATMEYFVFQRDSDVFYREYWEKMTEWYWCWEQKFKVITLNSIFFGQKHNSTIQILLDLMLYYWKTQNNIIDYFFFQILYTELIDNEIKIDRCPIVSDTIPHILQSIVMNGETVYTSQEAITRSGLHKLTYFDENEMIRLKEILCANNEQSTLENLYAK